MAQPEVDKQLIRDLAALLDETGLTEIEIEQDDHRLRIVRQPASVAASVAMPAPAAPGAANGAATPAPAEADPGSHPGAVTSPMVGTAYRAPDPTAAPFVNVGDTIQAGQTVVIIEAMKTFNEIPAPRSGVVKAIMVDNGTPVEYGDVLLIIE